MLRYVFVTGDQMKSLLVLKSMTLVVLLGIGFFHEVKAEISESGCKKENKLFEPAMPPGTYPNGTHYKETQARCVDNPRADKCITAMNEMRDSLAKFLDVCTAAGAGDTRAQCSTKLEQCTEDSQIEQPATSFMFSGMDFSVPTTGRCSRFSYTDYKTEAKTAKQALTDAKKTVDDVKKEQSKNEKDFTKDYNTQLEKMAEAKKENVEQALKAEESERNAEAQQEDTAEKLTEELVDLQSKELALQGAKLEANNARSLELKSFADRVKGQQIRCRMETEERATKFKSKTKKSDLDFGYRSCMLEFIATREKGINKLDSTLDNIRSEVEKIKTKRASLEKKIQRLISQSAQAKADRSKLKGEKEMAALQAQYKANAELDSLSMQMNQERIRIVESLSRATVALNQASNELADIDGQKPQSGTKKAIPEASSAMLTWATKRCEDSCSNISTTLEEKCRAMEKKVPRGVKSDVDSGAN